MSCLVEIQDKQISISDPERLLVGPHFSQLCFWGFHYDAGDRSFRQPASLDNVVVSKVIPYLDTWAIPYRLDESTQRLLNSHRERRHALDAVMHAGMVFKTAKGFPDEHQDFLQFAANLPRQLKDHQIKAALHLITVRNGANFSVPGSGKTTVALSVFQWLRSRGELDSIFVVGPPSVFAPWQVEYEEVTGSKPRTKILAGGDIEDRRSNYYVDRSAGIDLYLTTYQTLQRDQEQVAHLLRDSGLRFALIVDEAHYMKQIDGAWAQAALAIAPYASVRWVLTGTPFPHSYLDAFNLVDCLWPEESPISPSDRLSLRRCIRTGQNDDAKAILDRSIGPLFYRVRKADLHLASQVFEPPIQIQMNPYERRIYDTILDRIVYLSQSEFMRDIDLRSRLQRGRIIRLRQSASYVRLLATAVSDYEENLLDREPSLSAAISRYDDLEVPAKLVELLRIVRELRSKDEKVVIWSNFIGTLYLIAESMTQSGYGVEMIYGDTPTENASVSDELTREEIVRRFSNRSSGVDILVANPAACAESISLHKSCSHAIYYDLSYNCAQYLQSLDRIHRVGGSEDKTAHYMILQYANTIESDILANLTGKANNMSAVIDGEYPIYALDMFSESEELEAYARLFGSR